MTSALGIKELKRISDTWDPRVRLMAHGRLSLPSHGTGAGWACHACTHMAHTQALTTQPRKQGREVAADAARPRRTRRRRWLGRSDNGERRRYSGNAWYQRVAQIIAHLVVLVGAQEVVGVGRRRALSGGADLILSDGSSGATPAMWVVSGGRSGDGEHGGADHEGRASPTAAELEKNRRRRKP